jgi:valyl-tRNA synthetase
VLISGWGIAGEGMGKISKSRGGGPMPPLEMIERYSADAVRYWAASTGPGKDSVISEDKIQAGARLVTKLWNVARFCERFLREGNGGIATSDQRSGTRERILVASRQSLIASPLSPSDRWILSRLQRLIRRVTSLLEDYDYASAKSEIEAFFWTEAADNYLEMCKQRLYGEDGPQREAARFTLYHLLLNLIKLFAPFLPYVTEEIYREMFMEERGIGERGSRSIHTSRWPEADPEFVDEQAERVGQALVEIATAVRRYKSERSLPLGAELERLQVAVLLEADGRRTKRWVQRDEGLRAASEDLKSITRALEVEIVGQLDPTLEKLEAGGEVAAAVGGLRTK